MRRIERIGKVLVLVGTFVLAGFLAHRFGTGGLWHGFSSALAVAKPAKNRNYDLTRLQAVNATLKLIRDRYVEPDRVKPQDMLLSALNYIQRDVAQVIISPSKEKGVFLLRVDTHEKKLRVDRVLGPWDVAAKLREVFTFLQKHLADSAIDLRDVEYAACNGLLRTLDPHSVFLSPEAYKEMNLSTSGHFGGLGIVISIRDQLLTVIRPMPDTPAGRAGLERFDRVMKINNESTLNMPLDDAVRRLRGDPGTKVTVWLAREGDDGWKGTRKFVLTRERIKVRSVISRRLDGDIAYLRLKQFQQTSTREMLAAFEAFQKDAPIKGLVFDLRGNPGGLLDQAAKISDLFIRRGVLVSTVGGAEAREEKRAHAKGTQPDYPIVVLVSGSSASASEIVAGALKNVDRAIIVGQSTFGKGSVQLVFNDVTPDHAALKLTIAQYLTPGDRSIQGVGVTPHIELDTMTVDPLEMDLTVQRSGVRERDLSKHLSSHQPTVPSQPAQVLRYHLPQAERMERRLHGGDVADEFELDFAIRFARELVSKATAGRPASIQLRDNGKLIEQIRRQEIAKVSSALSATGIDWSMPASKPTAGPSEDELQVSVTTDKADNKVSAGDAITLVVKVTNNGSEAVYRLRARTQSDNPYYDERELVFGKIGPGESKTAETPLSWCVVEKRRGLATGPKTKKRERVCKIAKDALSRSDGVKVLFDAAGGYAPATAEIRPTIEALPRPLFQYSYQISDNIEGNGDGLVQRGERITIFLTTKNVGTGRSFETQANLANRSGDGVLLRHGRFDISDMMPGDVRHVAFTFDVQQQLREKEIVLSLSVGDRDLREFVHEKIKIPVSGSVAIDSASGVVSGKSSIELFGDVLMSRGSFARIAKQTPVKLLGRHGKMSKIALSDTRFAFVSSADLVAASGEKPAREIDMTTIYRHDPPRLTVRAATMATRDKTVRIDVEAVDSQRLLDMYMFVGPHKLYYQSNRKGADQKRASFTFNAPLQPGVNLITVVARETPDTTTRRTVVVRRDGKDGRILKTPKQPSGDFRFLLDAVDGQ
jgi:carboxyl-terminal processing protease